MATTLTKAVARLIERDGLVVTLAPEGVYVREKGKRTQYGPLAYGRLLVKAAEVNAEAIRSERKSRKVTRGLLSLGR